MRLLDAFGKPAAARTANYIDESTISTYFQQTYEGAQAAEKVLPTFRSYVENGYAGNAVVFGVILARAMLFSEATFKWRNTTTGKLFGDPSLKVLEKPWPNGTTGELLVRMEQDASLAGNAYIRKDDDRLVRLRPDWVTIILDTSGGDEDRSRWDVVGYGYDFYGTGQISEFYPVDEVAHWSPIPDPLAHYKGMSWLTPVAKEVNADIGMTEYKRRFVDNSATPNLLIKYQEKLTEPALAKVRATWNARYGGPTGLKTAVLDNGADVQVVGNTMQSMDFTAVQAAGENRIAAAGGVPGIVVGLKEGLDAATYSNYGQAMRRFADITMRPNWRSVCACLSQLVDAPAGGRLWYDVTDIAALREGEQERATTFQTLSLAADALIRAGYQPDTVTNALTTYDLSQLKHTGAIPTALYPNGTPPVPGAPTAPPTTVTHKVDGAPPAGADAADVTNYKEDG